MTHVFNHTASVLAIAALGLLAVPTHMPRTEQWDTALRGAVGVAADAEGVSADDGVPAPSRREQVSEASAPRCQRLPELFRVSYVGHRDLQGGYEVEGDKAALLARIHEAACHFGVDPAIGQGVAWTESRFDQGARSPDGMSVGAFQLTEVTAAEMRTRLSRTNVGLPLQDEVTLGVGYLRYLDRLFAKRTVLFGDGLATVAVVDPVERWRFAIAAYNCGEGRVAAAQRRTAALGRNPTRFDDVRPLLPSITRRYVDTVIAFGVSQGAAQVQIQATATGAGVMADDAVTS